MDNLLARERGIMRLIPALAKATKLVVVGGYAVSTYMRRFSVDLDIVISGAGLENIKSALLHMGFEKGYSKELENVYDEKFERYSSKAGNLPIGVDILVNGLVSRKTGASWGFEYVVKNSEPRLLEGVEFLAPKKELLVAMKLHSGRISDMRDVAALSSGLDIKEVVKHSKRGSGEFLNVLENGIKYLKSWKFKDGFKGVFGQYNYKPGIVDRTVSLLEEVRRAFKTG